YTCNVMRRNPGGSFIVSVLSATLSMFLRTWGVIVTVLSFIVRRNPGVRCGSASCLARRFPEPVRSNLSAKCDHYVEILLVLTLHIVFSSSATLDSNSILFCLF
ncbi:hypothetical protein B0H14DRAFT_2390849, partial [Mycena olivaceomarginata]